MLAWIPSKLHHQPSVMNHRVFCWPVNSALDVSEAPRDSPWSFLQHHIQPRQLKFTGNRRQQPTKNTCNMSSISLDIVFLRSSKKTTKRQKFYIFGRSSTQRGVGLWLFIRLQWTFPWLGGIWNLTVSELSPPRRLSPQVTTDSSSRIAAKA